MENWSKKSKTRIRRKNGGIRKLVFFAILLCLTIFVFIKVLVPNTITFARYIHSVIRSYYLSSKEFYFNSDKLATTTANFESSNWSGNNNYEVDITMNSRKNMNEHSRTDIVYNITYEAKAYKANGDPYPDNYIVFQLKDSNGQAIDLSNTPIQRTIFMTSDYSDKFTFSVAAATPGSLKNNDYIIVNIQASSVRPYTSDLYGEFKIIVGTKNVRYKIEDEEYSPYAELIITNEFDSYISKDQTTTLTIAQYLALDPKSLRDNYYSKKIVLEFDPTEVVLDTTSSVYIEALASSEPNMLTYETVTKTHNENGNTITTQTSYVKKITFYMGAEESKVIKFYKVDASQNYTYDSDDDYLAVSVSYS